MRSVPTVSVRGGIVAGQVVYICRHFAVLTVNPRVGQKQDHLFLVREGWRFKKILEFKVMTFGPVFENRDYGRPHQHI